MNTGSQSPRSNLSLLSLWHNTLTGEDRERSLKSRRRILKRILIAIILAALTHLVILKLSKLITLPNGPTKPIEVVNLSQQELTDIKKELKRMNELKRQAISEGDIRKEYQTEKEPENTQYIGPINQIVPEQTVAGPQSEAPQKELRKGQTEQKERSKAAKTDSTQQKLSLSALGIKTKPLTAQNNTDNHAANEQQGSDAINQKYRPLGLDAPGIKRGQQNLLNTKESKYYSFFNRFSDPIVRNWYAFVRERQSIIQSQYTQKRAKPGDSFTVVVEFSINRKGEFIDIHIVESSGIGGFDTATLLAVQKLGTLENPPAGIFEGKETFTHSMGFELVINAGIGFSEPNVHW